MLTQRVISVFALISILVSSVGVHIMHHDVVSCGNPSEVIALFGLFDEAEYTCCSCSDSEHESYANHDHHTKDSCWHEVLILKDTFFSQEMKIIFSTLTAELLGYISLNLDFTRASFNEQKILHPPALKMPSFAHQSTSSFRC